MSKREIPEVNALARETLGTRDARRVRNGGRLPAVIYGHKQDPVHVSLDQREFMDLLHRHYHLLNINTGGASESCLVKQVQYNHLGTEAQHVDLTRVDLNERVTVEVEIELHGEPAALQEEGAIMQQSMSSIEIECLVTEIPDSLLLEVGEMQVGDSKTVADLQLPEGVATEVDPDMTICSITVVQEASEEEEAAAETEGEPEVIGRDASEEGEGEEDEE